MIVKSKKKLKSIIDIAKKQNKSVLIKRGCFDIIHPGHILGIKKFKELADIVVILIMSDEVIKSRKGKGRPINSQKQRAMVIDGIKGVDYVYLDKTDSNEEYLKILEYLKPTIVTTLMYTPKSKTEFVCPYWKLVLCPDDKDFCVSTTTIVNNILKKYAKNKPSKSF
jgi:cytidyltransferase-like protein